MKTAVPPRVAGRELRPARRAGAAPVRDPAGLLELQRLAGNRATTMLVQRAGGGPGPAVPTLSGTVSTTEKQEGICGNFSRVRDWAVANPVAGVIIQEVTRTFSVERWKPKGWQSISGAGLDSYVSTAVGSPNATQRKYWEAWAVDGTGGISDRGDDTFGLCSLIPTATRYHDTTRGSFVISGTANFYPTATHTAVALGFTGALAVAGGLPTRSTDPAGTIGTAGLAASGSAVTYTATATWDSADKRTPAKKKKKTVGLYTPRDAWSKVTET